MGVRQLTRGQIHYTAYLSPDAAKVAASKRRPNLSFLLIAAAAGLMTAHMLAKPTFDSLQQRIFDVAAPVLDLTAKPLAAMQDGFSRVGSLFTVNEDNEALRAENEKLKEWYQAALMLQSENKALRDLLNVERDDAKNFITTRVIADGSNTYAKSLVVEGGRDAGVIKGQGVMSREGLIGRVIESGSRTARILLLQDINSRIPVLVEGSNDRAILAGTNGAQPMLDHLDEGNDIAEGQRVITSGLGGLFPYGIPVGVTKKNEDGTISVQLFAAPERSQHVQIVDYGIKPLLGDPIFNSASVSPDTDLSEPN